MKKFCLLVLLVFMVPSFLFAVSNAKVNGQKEVTVTQLPAELVFTCDLAASGNKVAVEYFIDFDNDGMIGPQEPVQEFFYITDGIGWIRNPDDSDDDFIGDETNVDGKIRTTTTIEEDEVFVPVGVTGIIKFTDEDGSTDMVKVTIQTETQPPYIQGKVTDMNTGTPLEGIFVIADSDLESYYGITDNSGDYQIAVDPGTYDVSAMEFPSVNYQMSDTVEVTVTGQESQTQNFQLEPFSCFVEGQITLENGSPVPGIIVIAGGGGMATTFFSMTTSDAQGEYRMGVMPGQVTVSASEMFNADNQFWPENHYVDPSIDSLVFTEGQTLTSDFVLKPYTSFVTGKCTIDGVGIPGVEITGVTMDFATMSFRFYETESDDNGDYRLGVQPGVLNTLTAAKDGYNLVDPLGGYIALNVMPNQTVTDKDFQFELIGTVNMISGTVTLNDGSPAANVYVAAENYYEENPDGFLITYTDGSGYFEFQDILDGYYHLGVYSSGYESEPPMRFFDLYYGEAVTNQDFVLSPGTGVIPVARDLVPNTIRLSQNFPNPFNPTTHIRFDLPEASHVEISIFNATGQKIRTLINRQYNAGEHQIEWNGLDTNGQKVSSGIYFYRLKTESFQKMMKMILAK